MKRIIVAKGLCTPARDAVTAALSPYGVRFQANYYSEGEHGKIGQDNEPGAFWNVAEINVSDQAAKWAEYLLCRTGKFWLRSKPHDRRNETWAKKWEGQMPTPWVEAGCKTQLRTPLDRSSRPKRKPQPPARQGERQQRAQRKERY